MTCNDKIHIPPCFLQGTSFDSIINFNNNRNTLQINDTKLSERLIVIFSSVVKSYCNERKQIITETQIQWSGIFNKGPSEKRTQ